MISPGKNIAIKVPLTWDGLRACRVLTDEGRMVNVTLCFSANQALLAAKAGRKGVTVIVVSGCNIDMDAFLAVVG